MFFKVGERRVVYAYVLLAAGLEVTVWMLPNILGNAIAFALVGVLMGKFTNEVAKIIIIMCYTHIDCRVCLYFLVI